MKYVRTKDGRIIDCVKLLKDAKKNRLQNEDDFALANAIINEKTTSDGWKRRVEKVADSIEELCDGFETIRDGKPYGIRYKNDWYAKKDESLIIWEDSIQEYLMYRRDGEDIVLKGFIRTEKALIFVAKANDKGELELI